MVPLPLENPNRLVSSRQSIGICARHVNSDCDNGINRLSGSLDRHRFSLCYAIQVLDSLVSLQVPQNTAFYLNVLQNTKTPKLTKKSENNKAKGLTNAN
jgi:hypothetical protein